MNSHVAQFSENGQEFPVTRAGKMLIVHHTDGSVSFAPRASAIMLKAVQRCAAITGIRPCRDVRCPQSLGCYL